MSKLYWIPAKSGDTAAGRLLLPGERAQTDRKWGRVRYVGRRAQHGDHQHGLGALTASPRGHFERRAVTCEVPDVSDPNGSWSIDQGVGTVLVCRRGTFEKPCPWCTGPFARFVEWLCGCGPAEKGEP